MRAYLRAKPVLEWRDDASAIRVVLGIRGGHHDNVERQAQAVPADLDITLFDDVEQPHLDPLSEVGELVDGENAAVGSRDQSVMDGELVAQVASLGDPDRIDLTDEIGDRRVRRRQLLAVALLRRDPRHWSRIAELADEVTAASADGLVRIVVDLASVNCGDRGVEQRCQRADQSRLRLTALTEKDEVLAGENCVLDLRYDRVVVAENPRKQLVAGRQLAYQVAAQLGPNGSDEVLGAAQLTQGRRKLGHRAPSLHRDRAQAVAPLRRARPTFPPAQRSRRGRGAPPMQCAQHRRYGGPPQDPVRSADG